MGIMGVMGVMGVVGVMGVMGAVGAVGIMGCEPHGQICTSYKLAPAGGKLWKLYIKVCF